jgi:cbb3-type cytochrome oxidase maturation protein
MTIIYFLIGCSIIMALLFLAAFFWALKSGQHDDMHTPAIRILFEDDKPDDLRK